MLAGINRILSRAALRHRHLQTGANGPFYRIDCFGPLSLLEARKLVGICQGCGWVHTQVAYYPDGCVTVLLSDTGPLLERDRFSLLVKLLG